MKCDRCGWKIAKKDYNGSGECFNCFDGQMTEGNKKELSKYEVIIPERRYIVIGLKEVKIVLDKYRNLGVCVRLIK